LLDECILFNNNKMQIILVSEFAFNFMVIDLMSIPAITRMPD